MSEVDYEAKVRDRLAKTILTLRVLDDSISPLESCDYIRIEKNYNIIFNSNQNTQENHWANSIIDTKHILVLDDNMNILNEYMCSALERFYIYNDIVIMYKPKEHSTILIYKDKKSRQISQYTTLPMTPIKIERLSSRVYVLERISNIFGNTLNSEFIIKMHNIQGNEIAYSTITNKPIKNKGNISKIKTKWR